MHEGGSISSRPLSELIYMFSSFLLFTAHIRLHSLQVQMEKIGMCGMAFFSFCSVSVLFCKNRDIGTVRNWKTCTTTSFLEGMCVLTSDRLSDLKLNRVAEI